MRMTVHLKIRMTPVISLALQLNFQVNQSEAHSFMTRSNHNSFPFSINLPLIKKKKGE